MYPHQPLRLIPKRTFQIEYTDPSGHPGTLLMQGLSIGGTLRDAELRFPELCITRVTLCDAAHARPPSEEISKVNQRNCLLALPVDDSY